MNFDVFMRESDRQRTCPVISTPSY